ncbi:MAG: hypothetical protein ACRDQG_14090 [Pseudonocardiaceae bacterium]
MSTTTIPATTAETLLGRHIHLVGRAGDLTVTAVTDHLADGIGDLVLATVDATGRTGWVLGADAIEQDGGA